MLKKNNITGLILAGGAGRRVANKDKGLISFKGTPLIQRQIEWMKPQVKSIIISANRNVDTYERFGYPVLTDLPSGNSEHRIPTNKFEFNGPLSGLYQGLIHCKTSHLYVQPVDLPFLPTDTIDRLLKYINQLVVDNSKANKTCSSYFLKTSQREHYLSLLIEQHLSENLKKNLESNNHRVSKFLQESRVTGIDLDIAESNFANFNDTDDFL